MYKTSLQLSHDHHMIATEKKRRRVNPNSDNDV